MDPFIDIKDWSDVDQVKNFLENHDVNTQDNDNNTALHFASEKGYIKIVKLLISRGADVNAKDKYERTPLRCFSTKISMGTRTKKIVKILISHEADVDSKDKYERTALVWASEIGSLDFVKILISHGADVNAKDYYEKTPLHYASMWGYKEIVKILIENKADVNAKDNIRNTPLHWASRYSYTHIVKILLNSPEINLKEYKNIEDVKKDVKETLNKRSQNMINKLKIIQIGCVGIEILEFIGGYLYPDITVGERLDIINKI